MIKIFIDKERADYDPTAMTKWLDEYAIDHNNNRHHWFIKYTDGECAVMVFGDSDSATAVAFKLKFGL